MDFTIPRDLRERLEHAVEPGQRSAFVAVAIREKLNAVERERIRAILREGYAATAGDNEVVDREWESATMEDWPK